MDVSVFIIIPKYCFSSCQHSINLLGIVKGKLREIKYVIKFPRI